jgi:hypothetical protein
VGTTEFTNDITYSLGNLPNKTLQVIGKDNGMQAL